MNIDLVIAQIKAAAPQFDSNVAGAAEYERSVVDQTWLPFPAAYVVPLDIEAARPSNQTGYNQEITEKIGVIVALDNSGDRRGQGAVATVDQVQAWLFSAILNWRPDSTDDNPIGVPGNPQADRESRGFWFDGAYLRGWDRSRLFFQFDFALDAWLYSGDGWQMPQVPLVSIENDIALAKPDVLEITVPPIFVLIDTSGNQAQYNAYAEGVQVAGIFGSVFSLKLADMLANDFGELDTILALTPSSLKLIIGITSGDAPTGEDIPYQTLTLNLSNHGKPPAPFEVPVIWDPAFIAAYQQGASNLAAAMATRGGLDRIFGLRVCPITRTNSDMELGVPSTNSPPYKQDFSADWLAAGYTDQVYIDALAQIAANLKATFPNRYFSMPILSPLNAPLGFGVDGGTFANEILTGVNAAVSGGGSFLVPMSTVITTKPMSDFILNAQALLGQVAYQTAVLIGATNDQVQAVILNGASHGPLWIEIHAYQADAAAPLIAIDPGANQPPVPITTAIVNFT